MSGLVEEIQGLALDPTVPVSDLLRKVKVAAVKLKLTEAVDWVEKELGGYNDVKNGDLPSYRRGHGTLMQQTPYGERVMHGNADTIAQFSQVFMHDPIASLESLAAAEGNTCTIGLASYLEKLIKRNNGVENCSYKIDFGKHLIVAAIDKVRGLVLDWALNLERQGILGEGISFTMEEKKKAAEVAQSITIHGNVANLHSGDVNGHQNRTVIASTDNSVNSLEINDTFDQLIQAVDSSIGHENDREAILDLVRAMQTAQAPQNISRYFSNGSAI